MPTSHRSATDRVHRDGAPRSFVPSSRRKDGQIKHTAFDVTDEPAVRTLFEKAGPLDQLFLTVTPSSNSERASGLTMTG
jgi:hypothetical protein